jgi:2-hydroxychromene-2-carboxylate isomerase
LAFAPFCELTSSKTHSLGRSQVKDTSHAEHSLMPQSDRRALTFWFEFASTYSYLSAMRIERLAAEAGVPLVWKPFLLGPIFKAQGWTSSPFNLYPAKGRYMVRDIERIAAKRGLPPFVMPSQFPANSVKAARLALVGLDEGWGQSFVCAVYNAQFAEGADIAAQPVLNRLLGTLGVQPDTTYVRSNNPNMREQLRTNTDHAMAAGLFGAPSFTTTDGEVFWGDDRLRHALSHAASL